MKRSRPSESRSLDKKGRTEVVEDRIQRARAGDVDAARDVLKAATYYLVDVQGAKREPSRIEFMPPSLREYLREAFRKMFLWRVTKGKLLPPMDAAEALHLVERRGSHRPAFPSGILEVRDRLLAAHVSAARREQHAKSATRRRRGDPTPLERAIEDVARRWSVSKSMVAKAWAKHKSE